MASGNLPGVSVTAARLQMQSSTTPADRTGRGRSGGLFDRGNDDRKPWNSDDEDFDEFGRRKKKAARKTRTASAKEPEPAPSATTPSASSKAPNPVDSVADLGSADLTGSGIDPDGAFQALSTDAQSGGKGTKGGGLSVFCKFQAEGRCSRGVSCPFSHDPAILQSMPLERKIRRLCRFFEIGKCTSGAACMYAHGPDELEALLSIRTLWRPPTQPMQAPQGSAINMQLPAATQATFTSDAEQAVRQMQPRQLAQGIRLGQTWDGESAAATPAAITLNKAPQMSPAAKMLAEAMAALRAASASAAASADAPAQGNSPGDADWRPWSVDSAGWGSQ